jgi:hypothetical protein
MFAVYRIFPEQIQSERMFFPGTTVFSSDAGNSQSVFLARALYAPVVPTTVFVTQTNLENSWMNIHNEKAGHAT